MHPHKLVNQVSCSCGHKCPSARPVMQIKYIVNTLPVCAVACLGKDLHHKLCTWSTNYTTVFLYTKEHAWWYVLVESAGTSNHLTAYFRVCTVLYSTEIGDDTVTWCSHLMQELKRHTNAIPAWIAVWACVFDIHSVAGASTTLPWLAAASAVVTVVCCFIVAEGWGGMLILHL